MKSCKKYLLLLSLVVCWNACVPLGSWVKDSTVKTLLPGECLAGTELIYHELDAGRLVSDNRFIFNFSLDLSGVRVEENTSYAVNMHNSREIPSGELFDAFSGNQTAVKNEFEGRFKYFSSSYSEYYHKSSFEIVTILYNGGISLTANGEFAGRPCPLQGRNTSLQIYNEIWSKIINL